MPIARVQDLDITFVAANHLHSGRAGWGDAPAASEKVAEQFDSPFKRLCLADVGHFPQREAPELVPEVLSGFFAGPRPIPEGR
jgi:hypothetical protein